MDYAVRTYGLTKQYKTTLAVDNIDFAVPKGSCCGFLGKNGAGKTTALNMIVGLKRPTSGRITIMGEEQTFGTPITTPFGYLPDVPNFYGYMTGGEFLDLCGKLCNIPASKRKARVKELLSKVGLDNTATKISGYSRGMKQRLGIAQAMINEPAVIFMDEPVSALDPIGRRDVVEIIKSLGDTTVIFSTHILADVESVCDYIIIIEKGKILAQDYLKNLREKHSTGKAKIRLYKTEDVDLFESHAKEHGRYTLERQANPLELLMHIESGDLKELSHGVMESLQHNDLAMEYFAAHTPRLEDIFYETIGM